MSRVRKLALVVATLALVLAHLASGGSPAGARPTLHNDNGVTTVYAPHGFTDDTDSLGGSITCTNRLVGAYGNSGPTGPRTLRVYLPDPAQGSVTLDAGGGLVYEVDSTPVPVIVEWTTAVMEELPGLDWWGGIPVTHSTPIDVSLPSTVTPGTALLLQPLGSDIPHHLTAVDCSLPIADEQVLQVPLDAPTAVTLTGSDAGGAALTFAVNPQPLHGTLSGTAPALTYVPEAGFTGIDYFSFTVSNGTATSAPGLVALAVSTVVGLDQSVTTPRDTPLSITLDALNPGGLPLGFSVLSGTFHGDLDDSAMPTLIYTPPPGFTGTDGFRFQVSDGTGFSTAIVRITVTEPVVVPPTAQPQSLTTPYGVPLTITLSAIDLGGGTLTYTTATQPANGTLSGTAPNVTYTPTPGFSGTDSFTFTAWNATATSDPATISITVAPPTPTDCLRGGALQWSTQPTRDGAQPLAGATIGGRVGARDVAVFLNPASVGPRILLVIFAVDGLPISIDTDAPYDLLGTKSGGTARLLDTRLLPNGGHRVDVGVVWNDGRAPCLRSTRFVVDNRRP